MSASRSRARRNTPAAAAFTQLVVATFRLNSRLLAASEQLSSKASLSTARWQVLETIAEVPLPAAWIARRLGLARQSVQRTVDLLEAEGRVRFRANPDHRRAKLVELTAAGREALRRVQSERRSWSKRVARGLAQRELEAATRTLQRLHGRLDSQG